MVVVKIEIWPHGRQIDAREIGRAYIANDNTGDHKYGNYEVELEHAGLNHGKPGFYKKGRFERFLRSLSPYHLVAGAFNAAFRGVGPNFKLQPGQSTEPAMREPGEEG